MLIFSTALFSQVPQGFSYQAVVRNNSGEPVTDSNVGIRIAILSSLTPEEIVWEEEHQVTTNGFGLVTMVIGDPSAVNTGGNLASFSDIDWISQPFYIKTSVYYPDAWQVLTAARIWSVPYAMASDVSSALLGNPVMMNGDTVLIMNNVSIGSDKPLGATLAVVGDNIDSEDALFEVRRSDGEIMFGVYNTGVRVNVPVNTPLKGRRGGFAIGGFDKTKGLVNDYLFVDSDSIRMYIDNNPQIKGPRGGFAIGGFDRTKALPTEYLGINPATEAVIINPGEPRVLWYPRKEAFMVGRVIVVHPDSIGTNSFSSGFESKAKGDWSQALGFRSMAQGNYSTAIGRNAKAYGEASFAFGGGSKAMNLESYAFGNEAVAGGTGSFAMGYDARATGQDSYAFGSGTRANGLGSFALGFIGRDSANVITPNTIANQNYSVAIGMGAQTDARGAFSIGTMTQATGPFAYAIGYQTLSSGWYSLATGYKTSASNNYATAMGYESVASGSHSIAIGQRSEASDWYSISIGSGNLSSNHGSIAFGSFNRSEGLGSLAIGTYSKALEQGAIAIGFDNQAMQYGLAVGYQNSATGTYSSALGFRTTSSGIYSFSSGSGSTAGGEASVALGSNTVTEGSSSIAAGGNTKAAGDFSAAFGLYSEANGSYSLAFGQQSIASGSWSFAGGQYNRALSWNCVALGAGATARGYVSAAFGLGTVSRPFASFVLGQYNDTTSTIAGMTSWVEADPVFSIGNGTGDSERSNAFTVLKNGATAIGHSDPTAMLDVEGNIRVRNVNSGSYFAPLNITADGTLTVSTSDERMKRDISVIDNSLEKVLNLRGVSFTWNQAPGDKHLGFIAQEVNSVLPEVVFKNPSDGMFGVNYQEVTAVLVEAVKEQQKIIDDKELRIRSLEERLSRLEGILGIAGEK